MEEDEIAIGHGVTIRWIDDGQGIMWLHPRSGACHAWNWLYFKPHPKSTGHVLETREPLTIGGSLLCAGGCGAHGHIRNGKWEPS